MIHSRSHTLRSSLPLSDLFRAFYVSTDDTKNIFILWFFDLAKIIEGFETQQAGGRHFRNTRTCPKTGGRFGRARLNMFTSLMTYHGTSPSVTTLDTSSMILSYEKRCMENFIGILLEFGAFGCQVFGVLAIVDQLVMAMSNCCHIRHGSYL